jgi:MATE family multidrug resistance protein
VAQLTGLAFALALVLGPGYRRRYRSHLTWRLQRQRLLQQLRLGVPMGLSPAADLMGFAVFQMMQTRLGTAGGAATQIVVILTSIAYMPGFGIASAGTTLVGQSIGAGAREWAQRVGDRVILLTACYMGGIGVLIALGGRWVLPFFTGAHDAEAAAAVAIGMQLLWLAAGYQFFDGLNLGSSMCLRGAGDVRVPALLVLAVALLLFMPLAHALTFAPGQGWVNFLPQFGWGAFGGWIAVLIYIMVLGTTLLLRWRSRAWQAIHL